MFILFQINHNKEIIYLIILLSFEIAIENVDVSFLKVVPCEYAVCQVRLNRFVRFQWKIHRMAVLTLEAIEVDQFIKRLDGYTTNVEQGILTQERAFSVFWRNVKKWTINAEPRQVHKP